MVGGLSMVGSSVVDSHTSPCLCLNALYSSNLNHKIGGDLALQRNWNSIGRKHLSRRLSSPFIHSGHEWRLLLLSKANKDSKKHGRKPRGLVIINEVAGQYEDSFEDVKSQLLNYFTYKAVRTVLNQLYEMNPTKYMWFYDFVATNELRDGNRFIRTLVKERQDLAERVMITRLHLYGKWVKKCNHAEIYKEISDQNLELMRERLMETIIWPSDDTNTEKIG